MRKIKVTDHNERLLLIKSLADFFNSKNDEELKAAYGKIVGFYTAQSVENNGLLGFLNGDVLECAFNRCFVGPEKPLVPTCAGFYLQNLEYMMSEVTLKFRKFYTSVGLENRRKNEIPDDYIGIGLDCYYSLLHLELVGKNDFLRSFRAVFLLDFLRDFVSGLSGEIKKKADNNAIISVGVALDSMLAVELEDVEALE